MNNFISMSSSISVETMILHELYSIYLINFLKLRTLNALSQMRPENDSLYGLNIPLNIEFPSFCISCLGKK